MQRHGRPLHKGAANIRWTPTLSTGIPVQSSQGAVVPEDVARDPPEQFHPTARSILVAARTVLRERGMAGLTIEAVANQANTSRTPVPYHFGSRAGLIETLFDWLFYEVWMRFLRPLGGVRPMSATLVSMTIRPLSRLCPRTADARDGAPACFAAVREARP